MSLLSILAIYPSIGTLPYFTLCLSLHAVPFDVCCSNCPFSGLAIMPLLGSGFPPVEIDTYSWLLAKRISLSLAGLAGSVAVIRTDKFQTLRLKWTPAIFNPPFYYTHSLEFMQVLFLLWFNPCNCPALFKPLLFNLYMGVRVSLF